MNIKILFHLFLIPIFCSSATLAEPDTSPLIFGFEVSDVATFKGTNLAGSYTYESVVTSIDQTTFPTTTYVVENRANGETERLWIEYPPGERKLWGTQEVATGELISISSGLVEAWFPMQVGDQRISSATSVDNLYPGLILSCSLTVDVLAKEPVVLGFDTLVAFKARYRLRIWGYGYDETDTFYEWWVPYIGQVKYQDSEDLEILTSFAIGGGTITEKTDTDGDGLKDYQELIVYNTNRQDADTDDDGYSDGEEVAAGTDPNDPSSHISLASPWIPLLLLDD